MEFIVDKKENIALILVEGKGPLWIGCVKGEQSEQELQAQETGKVLAPIYFDRLYESNYAKGTLIDTEVYEVCRELVKEYSMDKVLVFVVERISEAYSDIEAFAERLNQSIGKLQKNRKIVFSDCEQKEIDELKQKIPFSFQMTEELNKNLNYMKCCGADISEVIKGCLEEDCKADKNTAKKVLNAIKKGAVTCNWIKEANTTGNYELQEFPFVKGFSNVYLEEEIAETYGNQYPEATVIHHYKDIFNRHNQDAYMQKKAQSLILAVNHDTLIYPGAPFCQSFGNEYFYYLSNIKNCIYNCEYCYLQGMYPCGHLVVFVNLEDYFREVDRLLKEHPVYICISYDTDLLALEPRFHFVQQWLMFAKDRPDLKIEVRTKCGNQNVFGHFREMLKDQDISNVIFAWTMSPEEVVDKHERLMPGLADRLEAVKAALNYGFKVRLCFDPMIYVADWQKVYANLFSDVFNEIDANQIEDVSLGVFRISSNFLKKMRDRNEVSAITAFPYVTEKGACHYGDLSHQMVQFGKSELEKYYPAEKIFCWEGIE